VKQINITGGLKGHISALVSIVIWGITFVATTILLREFIPAEILFFRFAIALIALTLVYPRRLKGTNLKQELYFMAAGLCVTLYFMLEIIALTLTSASNVGVIVSAAPFLTALLANWFLDGEKPGANFFIGFISAIIGIALISFNGITAPELNPIGDLLAFLAAVVWAVYSIVVRKISKFGHNTIQTTRRIFVYGIVAMLPFMLLFPFEFGAERFTQSANIVSILFLGLGASALCFVAWNFAVRVLGAVKTSVYIYLGPVVTVVTSVLVLSERLTWMLVLGTALILSGLVISEKKPKETTACSETKN